MVHRVSTRSVAENCVKRIETVDIRRHNPYIPQSELGRASVTMHSWLAVDRIESMKPLPPMR